MIGEEEDWVIEWNDPPCLYVASPRTRLAIIHTIYWNRFSSFCSSSELLSKPTLDLLKPMLPVCGIFFEPFEVVDGETANTVMLSCGQTSTSSKCSDLFCWFVLHLLGHIFCIDHILLHLQQANSCPLRCDANVGVESILPVKIVCLPDSIGPNLISETCKLRPLPSPKSLELRLNLIYRQGADTLITAVHSFLQSGALSYEAKALSLQCRDQEQKQTSLHGSVPDLSEVNRQILMQLHHHEQLYSDQLATISHMRDRLNQLQNAVCILCPLSIRCCGS